jgi:hypothetical protein
MHLFFRSRPALSSGIGGSLDMQPATSQRVRKEVADAEQATRVNVEN